MHIQVENMKRCDVVRVSGQIDSANGPVLEQELVDLIENGKRNLVVNLSEVTFISSPGIKALLTAQVKARRRVPYGATESSVEEAIATARTAMPHGELVLSEVPPRLRETLELVGLHHLFQIFGSDLEAVGSF